MDKSSEEIWRELDWENHTRQAVAFLVSPPTQELPTIQTWEELVGPFRPVDRPERRLVPTWRAVALVGLLAFLVGQVPGVM